LRVSPRSTRLHWRFPRCRALGCSKCSRDNYISWGHLKRKERKFWMMGWWRAFFLLLKLCWLLMYTNGVFVFFCHLGFASLARSKVFMGNGSPGFASGCELCWQNEKETLFCLGIALLYHWQLSELPWWDIIPRQYYRVYWYIITSHLCIRIFQTTMLRIYVLHSENDQIVLIVYMTGDVKPGSFQNSRTVAIFSGCSGPLVCWCTTQMNSLQGQRRHNFPKSWKK